MNNRKWGIVKVIVLISVLVPIGLIAYELIYLGKHSVVFLKDYHVGISIIIISYYVILLILVFVWLTVQVKSILTLKNENKKSEVLHLQSQVSPHFFFNMLNNLYGLIDKDVEQSKELVLKLSDLMRYSVYEGGKERVSIQEEVKFLNNYIELHQMRYHKSIDIKFKSKVSDGIKVTPLLLIILLENAFKHGVENMRENAYVYIDLFVDEKQINFKIENNFDQETLELGLGIGLKNLRKRLKLIYPNNHNLDISSSNNIHTAKLRINI